MKKKIKSCIDCINYHEEPVQGGHVPVCVAKKGEFYGSYVVKNQNDVCEKYCTPYMKRKKAKQPTFSDCIKEWEERGWSVSELKQFPVIKIWKLNKEQDVIDNIYVYPKKLNSTIDFNADYGTLNLLTKTIKALEEKEDG